VPRRDCPHPCFAKDGHFWIDHVANLFQEGISFGFQFGQLRCFHLPDLLLELLQLGYLLITIFLGVFLGSNHLLLQFVGRLTQCILLGRQISPCLISFQYLVNPFKRASCLINQKVKQFLKQMPSRRPKDQTPSSHSTGHCLWTILPLEALQRLDTAVKKFIVAGWQEWLDLLLFHVHCVCLPPRSSRPHPPTTHTTPNNDQPLRHCCLLRVCCQCWEIMPTLCQQEPTF